MPSAPEGLTVVTVNTTSVELSWEAPAMIYANELGPYYVTYGIDETDVVVRMFSVHGGALYFVLLRLFFSCLYRIHSSVVSRIAIGWVSWVGVRGTCSGSGHSLAILDIPVICS